MRSRLCLSGQAERELLKHGSSVALPYWDWTKPITELPELFTQQTYYDPWRNAVEENPFARSYINSASGYTVRDPQPELFKTTPDGKNSILFDEVSQVAWSVWSRIPLFFCVCMGFFSFVSCGYLFLRHTFGWFPAVRLFMTPAPFYIRFSTFCASLVILLYLAPCPLAIISCITEAIALTLKFMS